MTNSLSRKCAALVASLLLGSGVAFGHSAGETGTALSGHLRDSNNHPVLDSSKECINLGYSLGPDHPHTPPGDCTVQPPPPPPPAPVVAPEPAPAPPPPPPPAPKMVKQKITLQADALFDFDKAVLKPAGKASINDAVSKMKQAHVTAVSATGHTDSIGKPEYNKKLGLRRAQAVKDYMATQGVAASTVTVDSKGETQPVASNKTKEGRSKNRRVEIEFDGEETVTVPAK